MRFPSAMLALLLPAGCRAAPQPIASVTGRVIAIAVAGERVWWIQSKDADYGQLMQAPVTGGAAEEVCRVGDSYGLAVAGGQPYFMQPAASGAALTTCEDGNARAMTAPLEAPSGPMTDGHALLWTEIEDPGLRSTVLLRRWVPGDVAPTTTWRGPLATFPPAAPAVGGDGTVLWQGSGGVQSMSRGGAIARVASSIWEVLFAAGGSAWWERPASWDEPSTQAPSSSPSPNAWQRVRKALHLETPDVQEPGKLVIAGAPQPIDTGVVLALAGDARGVTWVDAGVPVLVHHGPPGNFCNDCYDSVEPLAGTGAIRLSDGGSTRTLARGEFAGAIAVDDGWVYVADVKAARLERIARPR